MTTTTATRRRRFAARTAVCVGLGVVTTVVVALAFAAWPVPRNAKWSMKDHTRPLFPNEGDGLLDASCLSWYGFLQYEASATSLPPGMPLPFIEAGSPETIPPRWLRGELLPWCFAGTPWPRDGLQDGRMMHVFGWPIGAFSSGVSISRNIAIASATGGAVQIVSDVRGTQPPQSLTGWFPNATIMGTALLPTHPVWPGLLADTAFYGVLWAAALFGPRRVRLWIRTRRGHCALCGYDKKGLAKAAPCPECGGGVQPAA